MSILSKEFYQRSNVQLIAAQLLGKWLCTDIDGNYTAGMIIETEAYAGAEDRASHAYNNRRTARTEVMFHPGGLAYVYLCYGMHHLFNVVTNKKEIPHAVLIRAIDPTDGIDIMLKRRKKEKVEPNLTNGPGTVCQALGIDKRHNGADLNKKMLWIEDRSFVVDKRSIEASKRIGVDYAGEDAYLPWRFCLRKDVSS